MQHKAKQLRMKDEQIALVEVPATDKQEMTMETSEHGEAQALPTAMHIEVEALQLAALAHSAPSHEKRESQLQTALMQDDASTRCLTCPPHQTVATRSAEVLSPI